MIFEQLKFMSFNIKKLYSWFFNLSLFSNKAKEIYGLSFDDGVKLGEIKLPPIAAIGQFCNVAKEIGYFEVTNVDLDNSKVTILEICTVNEYTIDIDFFNYLFERTPTVDSCVR